MQEKHLFEYAIIRIVPRVEREEFMNIGVILYSSKPPFLQVRFHLDEARLHAFSNTIDMEEVMAHLLAFERICAGGESAGPIGKLDMASRFRWLTATRSTIVQTSKVHPGFCPDNQQALARLFTQLVL